MTQRKNNGANTVPGLPYRLPYKPYGPCQTGAEAEFAIDVVAKRDNVDKSELWGRTIALYSLLATDAEKTVPLISAKVKQQAMQTTLDEPAVIHGARIYGEPAYSLRRSHWYELASGRISSNDLLGIRGEENLAKCLSRDGILDRCVSFWSAWNVDRAGFRSDISTDIDCILKFGDHILLIDAKNYFSGVRYHTLIPGLSMFCETDTGRTGVNMVKNVYALTKNMAYAQRNLSYYFSSCRCPCTVESFMVLMPGAYGDSTVDVDVRAPGNIPVMTYATFLDMLHRRVLIDNAYAAIRPKRTTVEAYLATLVRHREARGDTDEFRFPLSSLENPLPEDEWPQPVSELRVGYDDDFDGYIAANTPRDGGAIEDDTFESFDEDTADTELDYAQSGGRKSAYARDYTRDYQKNQKNQKNVRISRSRQKAMRNLPPARVSTSRRNRGYLTEIPPVRGGTDFAIAAVDDAEGNAIPLSFKNVSGMIMVGGGGSGCVQCAATLVASLLASREADVRIIDCGKGSSFKRFDGYATSYVRLRDGLDAVGEETAAVVDSLGERRTALDWRGVGSFWDQRDHGGLRPVFLIINKCSELFRHLNDDDTPPAADIYRSVQRILTTGADVGVCVILVAEDTNLSADVIPMDIVALTQVRACFYMRDIQLLCGILGVDTSRDGSPVAFGEGPKSGQAFLITEWSSPEEVTFRAVKASVIDERFPRR